MRKRSRFDLSHINSTTCKMGYIVPVMLTEALPGDTFQGDTKLFTRVAPLNAPVMHRVQQQLYTFFVPNRLLWSGWEAFITNDSDNLPDAVNVSIYPPTVDITPSVNSLADYFGLPLLPSGRTLHVSALPFRAYNLIYNDYFRDQDLQEKIPFSTLDEGAPLPGSRNYETPTDLLRANWAKDYFTTARPWPQKGEAISIPLSGDAPVYFDNPENRNGVFLTDRSGNPITSSTTHDLISTQSGYLGVSGMGEGGVPFASGIDPNDTLWANLEAVSSATVDELRQAFALQKWQEKRSVFGSRYEDLMHFWGLSTQDYRLQRPELISIRSAPLQFSEVLQTSPVGDGSGVGDMAGHGIGAMRSGRWRYYCHEHGFLMTLLVIRPQAVYTQGLERMWTRQTFHDYWNPEFQHIGQQEILRQEIFADGSDVSEDIEIWGYQNRYDEYRRGKNHVTGEFRTTLDFWNLARQFENAPALNSEFITCAPSDRIFQLSESLSDQFYILVQNDLVAKRLMSRQGNPI